jgi:hypothetical protein
MKCPRETKLEGTHERWSMKVDHRNCYRAANKGGNTGRSSKFFGFKKTNVTRFWERCEGPLLHLDYR